MRTIYAINGLGTGGAERSLAELLPFFSAAGIHPTVAVMHARTEGVESKVLQQGADVRFLSGGMISRVAGLRRLIREVRAELVHTTIWESDIAGRLAAVGTGVPVLTSLVNTSYEPIRLQDPNVGRLALEGARIIDGWTGRHLTEHFHAITEAVKDSAVRSLRISDGDVTVIERGRDPDRLGLPGSDRRAAARQMLGLSEDDQVLLTVGRQEFQKGQIHLVEAMPEIVRRHPRAILLLAGRAGQASDDLRLAHEESAVQSHIRFLGHRNDIPELLAAADAFVFPSLYEGLGGAVIEAMALDLPIVASDVPAIREVVEDGRNALLVKSGSPSAIADAVAVLLADQDRRNTFAKRSGEIFRDRFTLQRSATRMVKLYENLVQGRTRSSAIVAQRVSGPPADRTNATV